MKRVIKWMTIDRLLLLGGVLLLLFMQIRSDSKVIRAAHFSDPIDIPRFSEADIDAYFEEQEHSIREYRALESAIESLLKNHRGVYSVYYEDLTDGTGFGLREKDDYKAASLYKVFKLATVLKRIERKEIHFNDEVALRAEDISGRSGPLGTAKPGDAYTVRELLSYMIVDSDNTAANALLQVLTEIDLLEANFALGLRANEAVRCSPESYSHLLRSLYTAGYLRAPFANYALNLMINTAFTNQISAGVPAGIPVAHKVGWDIGEKSFHDCGIVFAKNPYILCIMSRETDRNESDRVMTKISRMVYEATQGTGG